MSASRCDAHVSFASALAPIDLATLWAFACGLWAGAPSGATFLRLETKGVALILALWLAADLAPRAVRRAGEAFGRWALAPQAAAGEMRRPALPYAQPLAPITRWRAAWLGLGAERPAAARAIAGGVALGCVALWLAASLGRTALAAQACLLLVQAAMGLLAERRPRLARAVSAGALAWGAWLLGGLALAGWSWPLFAVGAWAGLGMAAAAAKDGAWLGRTASALIVVALLALRQPLVAVLALAQALAAEAWRRAPARPMGWPVVSWAGVLALAALAAQPALAMVATWRP